MNETSRTNEELQKELNELQQKYNSLVELNQTEIRESREKTSYLLDHAVRSISECVSITDMENNIIFVNDAFLNTYQYEIHELLGNNIKMVRSPDNYKDLVEVILPSTLRGGWQGEVLNRRKDGTDFPVHISASVIKDYNGAPIALIGVSSDITNQKKSEQQQKVIYEITQAVAVTDDLGELLLSIHQSLKKVFYAENCFVAIHDKNTGLFSFPYFVDQFDPTPEPVAMAKSCSAYVYRTGKSFLFTPEEFQKLEEQDEVRQVGSFSPSWVGIPLKTPQRTIGVLVLQHYEKENVYSERDIEFLDSVGSQIALAIERRQAEIEIRNNEHLKRPITHPTQGEIPVY